MVDKDLFNSRYKVIVIVICISITKYATHSSYIRKKESELKLKEKKKGISQQVL